MMKDKFIAFYAADYEFKVFGTFKEAEAWLQNYDDPDYGISEETTLGRNYIAGIAHVSHYEITDEKKNYHEHTDDCPEDCDLEEWPYSDEFECVGKVSYVPVEKEGSDA